MPIGFVVVFFGTPTVLLGVVSLAALLRRLFGADWQFTRRFEVRIQPKNESAGWVIVVAHVALVIFALCQVAFR